MIQQKKKLIKVTIHLREEDVIYIVKNKTNILQIYKEERQIIQLFKTRVKNLILKNLSYIIAIVKIREKVIRKCKEFNLKKNIAMDNLWKDKERRRKNIIEM